MSFPPPCLLFHSFLLIATVVQSYNAMATSLADMDHHATLKGAGGSMGAQLFSRLNRMYDSAVPDLGLLGVDIIYESTQGSVAGREKLLAEGSIHFAVVDYQLPQSDFKSYRDLFVVPFVASALVPVINIAELEDGQRIILSRELLAGIFMGTVTRWDDAGIVSLNPTIVDLPPEPIRLLLPTGTPKSAEIFAQALSSFSPEFAGTVGLTLKPRWCNGDAVSTADPGLPYNTVNCSEGNTTSRLYYTATGKEGLTAAFTMLPYSITFLYYNEAIERDFASAMLINKANATISASVDTITNSLLMAEGTFDTRYNASVLDTVAPRGWPIVSIAYLTIRGRTHLGDCQERRALAEFFRWVLVSPQYVELAHSLGYAVLSEHSRKSIVADIASQVSCVSNCVGIPKALCSCIGTGRRCRKAVTPSQKAEVFYLGYPSFVESSVHVVLDGYKGHSSHSVGRYPGWREDKTLWSAIASDLYADISMGLVSSKQMLAHLATSPESSSSSQDILTNGEVALTPFFVGSVGIAFNLNSLRMVTVTPDVLADIYLGKITLWNDPRIQQLNSDVSLPPINISIVIDAGALEISEVLITYLRNVSQDFHDAMDANSNLNHLRTFRSNVIEMTSELSLRGAVAAIEGAIGGVWIREEDEEDINVLLLQSARGIKMDPFLSSIRACFDALGLRAVYPIDRFASIFDNVARNDRDCWPLVVEYNLMVKRVWNADGASSTAQEVADFLQWFIGNDLREALAVLSPEVASFVMSPIAQTISLGEASILSPQPPCSREHMVYTLSACHEQVVTARFNWASGTESRSCLNGQPLYDDIEISCDHVPLGSSVAYGIIALVVISSAVLVPFLGFTFHYRYSKALVASQVNFTLLFIMGATFLVISSLSLIGPNDETNCIVRPWTLSISFSVLFAPLLMKLKRVYTLFGQRTLRRAVVSNLRVAAETSVFVLIDVLILLSWQFGSKISSTTAFETIEILGDVPRELCDYGNNAGMIVMLTYKCLVLGVGVYLAIKSWDIVADYSEAKQLAIGLYNVTLMGGLTLLLTMVIDTSITTRVLLLAVSCCMVALICVILVMTPKLLYLYKNPNSRTSTKKASAAGHHPSFSRPPARGSVLDINANVRPQPILSDPTSTTGPETPALLSDPGTKVQPNKTVVESASSVGEVNDGDKVSCMTGPRRTLSPAVP